MQRRSRHRAFPSTYTLSGMIVCAKHEKSPHAGKLAEASGCRTFTTRLESVKLLILQVDEMEEMAKLGFYPYKRPYTGF